MQANESSPIGSVSEAAIPHGGVPGRRRWPPAVVLVPALLVGAAVLLPVAYLVLRTAGAGSDVWDLLLRGRTLDILLRSVALAAAVTGASVVIAVPLAWLTVRTDLPLRRLWSVLTPLPLVIPSYIAGFVVVSALGPRGMIQDLLEGPFGVERIPDIYGFPGAMLTLTFLSYPYVLLTVRAALWNMDPALEEISRSLGNNPLTTFFRVTLPLLRPSIAAGSLLVALYTLSDFGAVSLLQYETFTWAIYIQYQSALDRAVASGLSLALVVLALGILLLEAGARGRTYQYRSTVRLQRTLSRVPLGRWRWPAFGFCSLVVSLALALPLSVLLFWLVRGVSAGEPLSFVWGATWNSVYVSALAAGFSVLAGLPVAVMVVRYGGRLSALLERVTYIGFALPGIAVALALVFFGVRYATPVYQTLVLLIFAYVVLYLPAAVGSARTSLLQLNPSVEEAARGLGKRPLQVMASVTLPLIRPGILAGGALVFLLTMKELPATLVLGPIGFNSLATSIWSSSSEAFFARAAAPALLLIVVSAVPMAMLMLWERRPTA